MTPEAYGDAIHLLINVYCSIAFKKNQGQKCDLGEMTDKKKEAVEKMGTNGSALSPTGPKLKGKFAAFASLLPDIFRAGEEVTQKLDDIIHGVTQILRTEFVNSDSTLKSRMSEELVARLTKTLHIVGSGTQEMHMGMPQ